MNNKRIKKLLSIWMMSAVMAGSLFITTACGSSDSESTPGGSDTQTEEPAGEPEAEVTPEPTEDPVAAFQQVVPKKPSADGDIYPKTKLSWKEVAEATSYHVYRAKKADGNFEEIGTTEKTTYVDKKAKARKTWFYKIQAAKDIDGTEALSDFSKPREIYVRPAEPKTVVVGECFALALEKDKEKLPSYYSYIAQGGMTTDSILNNNCLEHEGSSVTAIEKAAMMNPDRVIFLVGANNSGHVDPTNNANNFVKMHKLMKKINPHVEFVVLAVSPWNKNGTTGRKMTSHEKRYAINRAYKAMAAKNDNIWYCPLPLDLEDEDGNLLGKFNGGDGLHWSNYARDYMAEHLKDWLKENLGSY